MTTMSKRGERAFPNEIFALIIDTLHDDHTSLQNTALVSRCFATLCQAIIFRQIKLRANPNLGYISFIKRIHRFAALLRSNPSSYSIGEFVKTLTFDTYRLDHWPQEILDDLSFILHNLRSLTVIRMELTVLLSKSHSFIRRDIIDTGHTNHLKELVISDIDSLEALENLCRTVSCLTVLEVFAILVCYNFPITDLTLILPSSVKVAVFGRIPLAVLRVIASGMTSHPPNLDKLYLELPVRVFDQANPERPEAEVFHSICRAIGPHANVILGVNGSVSGLKESVVGDIKNCFRELAVPRVTLACSVEGQRLTFAASLVAGLPRSVRQIRIDFDVGISYWPDRGDWTELDAALVKRREIGLLDQVVFTRSTREIPPFTNRELYERLDARAERTVLPCVPASKCAGFVEEDRNVGYLYHGLSIM
ncbi:hypothetical protein D9757_001135 [Collybiopsis confluens]|uniref:F-box domain-containing protein n=1 Tax=Collybiopsis confluens TaxID=2823264 RepID=A0A8H5I1F4_9AGAR|nr:hypothetical protein D9757_001135 [Collybiopsis confluens]